MARKRSVVVDTRISCCGDTNRLRFMRTVGVTVLVCVACGCDEPTPTTPSGGAVTIHGRVVDFAAGTGLSGAVLRLEANGTDAVTDPSGAYTMSVRVGRYRVSVNGVDQGSVRVTGRAYRGDLLIDRGTCVSRYGTLADARTLRPVAGATISLSGIGAGAGRTTSAADGWYRVDLGCPQNNRSFNTSLMTVTHPDYASHDEVVGRGIYRVSRIDVDLTRQ